MVSQSRHGPFLLGLTDGDSRQERRGSCRTIILGTRDPEDYESDVQTLEKTCWSLYQADG